MPGEYVLIDFMSRGSTAERGGYLHRQTGSRHHAMIWPVPSTVTSQNALEEDGESSRATLLPILTASQANIGKPHAKLGKVCDGYVIM